MRGIVKVLLITLLFLVIAGMIVGLVFAIYVNKKIEKNIDESLFSMVGSDSSTTLYYYEQSDNGGKTEAVELTGETLYGGYRCVYVDFEKIPDHLVNAFVSIEDKRFYDHKGVDWKRTVSAGVNYFLKFSDSFGGSTITQQLIKNVTDKDEYSFQRKLQEIFWALDLETKMDKQEILGLYLNIINLSQGCYGVQAASEYYFSKSVWELSLSECACIAAITNSPSYYDPILNPENNKSRRDLILKEMQKQGYISVEEMEDAMQKELALKINEKYDSSEINSWYVDMVLEDIINDLVEEKGYSRTMANLMIYTGGLKIYTAMDPQIQSILDGYYENTANFYSNAQGEAPQSAIIVIDPQNGDILGVAGAIGRKNANRIQNFATQTNRPAGSVIKPLSVYAPALDRGLITWASVYDDVPVSFGKYNLDAEKGEIVQPVAWPKNSTGTYRGLTNVNYALAHSVNTVTVRVLEDLGLQESFDFLYDELNMKSLISSGYTADGAYITDIDLASLALGQMNYGVTVREITAAYSIFVNQGIYNAPRSYYKVTDSAGSIVLENRYAGKAVIGADSASVVSRMLQDVVKSGTATAISLQKMVECAGKTGTTQNNYDRWYVGYTPYFIGGVWYGYEYPKALSGSNICIDIWDDIMTRIHEREVLPSTDRENLDTFSLGENVVAREYCSDSGALMTQACQRDPRGTRKEIGYFVAGTEPTEYCTCHIPVKYDSADGGVCLDNLCPSESVQYVGMIQVKRSFPIQITVTDAQYVWREIGSSTLPETSPTLPFFNHALAENEFCGISSAEVQYNHFCRTHFDYIAWKEKQRK